MRFNKFLLALFALYLPSALLHYTFSQALTQTVRGIVVDADSKAPIELVGVKILNTDSVIYSVTDAAGKFRLAKVPVGRHAIKFSIVGYDDVVLQNIVVTTGKEIVLNVEMREKLLIGKEVEIVFVKDKTKANNDLVTNSARSFDHEEAERYAGSRGDPSKMAANYAGVATGNDARNDIIVRGNSPLGVLWRLEDTDIPSPNHFSTQGATGGPVSILNNNLLGSSDFLTGAFPSQYGNRMAAVFDLKMRNGNNEKTEYTGQIGMNGLEAGIEGPLSKKNGSSFLINYRYSNFSFFKALGIHFGTSGIPTYQDISYKINIPTSKKGVFCFWGIGGMSDIALLDSERDSADWSFVGAGEDLRFGSKMGAAGMSHLYFFNDKISGKFNFSASGTQNKVTDDTLSKTKDPFRIYTNNSKDWQYYANYTVTDKINAHHLVKIGATWKPMFADYHETYYSKDYKMTLDQLNTSGSTSSVQSFVHWQYRITEKLAMNTGVHFNYFDLSKSYAIEPRTGIRWQFLPKQTLSFAFGMHSQSLPLVYYFYHSYDSISHTYSNTNKSIDFSKSRQYVIGYDFNFAKSFRFKLEAYYQDLYNVPISQYHSNSYSTINTGNELDGLTYKDSLINKGTGTNYGVEITLEKFFSKNYYFLNSLSLYDSRYKGSDGVERHSAFSGGYVYNLLGGVEIPTGMKNHTIGIDVKFSFAGGNRYTPIDVQRSLLEKRTVYIDSLAFSKQFAAYQKIDVKLSYRINRKKVSHYFFINVENILNRKNILQQVFNASKQEITYDYQLGLFPYGGYRIEF